MLHPSLQNRYGRTQLTVKRSSTVHLATPTPATIRAQVDRILRSEAFRKSAILSRFLQHVVEENLAGNSMQLKEYSIALTVLGRKTDFNPQNDAIVRIHAGRLRRALQEYYQGPGNHDPIYIDIPKGSYVPEFSLMGAKMADEQVGNIMRDISFKVTVAVLPFSNISPGAEAGTLADGLGDAISTELTRYPELGVISYNSCRSMFRDETDIKVAGEALGAEFILTGRVQSIGDQLRIGIQLSKASTRNQIWAETFERVHDNAQYFNIQREIAWQVVSQTAGHFGAISRNLSRTYGSSNADLRLYNTLYWYYDFVNDHTEDVFHKAEKTLTEALRKDPDYALGWAILGEVCIGGYFSAFTSKILTDPLDRALGFGKRSIQLDPLCQHGYQTLAFAHLFRQEWNDCLRTIRRWETIKPPSSGVQCVMGFLCICLGEYETGIAMCREAMRLNPYYQWFINAGICFYYFHLEEFVEAYEWAEKMNRPDVPWWYLLRGCCLYEMGRTEEAELRFQEMLELFPYVRDIMPEYIHAFIKDDQLTDRFQQIFETAQARAAVKKGA